MANDTATQPASGLDALASRLADDLLTLDKELGEVDLLIAQAKTEAARHETRRASAAEKLAGLPSFHDVGDRLEQTSALVGLTKRAGLMETQVEVLDGKRRALARYRDAIADHLGALRAAGDQGLGGTGGDRAGDEPMAPAMARLLMGAQEDLRREIARAMHDGPAQSLTNIVLQAQIVERLVGKDPEAAGREVQQLVSMVQQTLDATKTFIFDVRPMVLDDLGLVPTLRRATRERSRRAGIPVDFESMGQDQRLPMDLESGVFRMLDEALAGYLGEAPDRVTMHLDWSDRLTADVVAMRAMPDAPAEPDIEIPTQEADKNLPPALAALVEDRRNAVREAAAAAVRASVVILPSSVWREIQDRAASVGVVAELRADGGHLHLATELPTLDAVGGPEAG
jgi:two-component system, NarL family, sensor histidine kinase DegS